MKGGVALVLLGSIMPAAFVRAVFAQESRHPSQASEDGRVLVVIQMAGGNDGLNTLPPYKEGRYYDVRGSLAIPQEQVLPLNDRIGFHPSLAPMKSL